jgi:hypothetical protein
LELISEIRKELKSPVPMQILLCRFASGLSCRKESIYLFRVNSGNGGAASLSEDIVSVSRRLIYLRSLAAKAQDLTDQSHLT